MHHFYSQYRCKLNAIAFARNSIIKGYIVNKIKEKGLYSKYRNAVIEKRKYIIIMCVKRKNYVIMMSSFVIIILGYKQTRRLEYG